MKLSREASASDDSNQHVNQLWYDAAGWHGADLTAAVIVPNASLTAGFTSWIQSDGPHVVYVATNQHVHQLWYDSVGWHSQDLTSMVNGPLAAVRDIISGQVTAGGAALSGVTVTLSGNTAAGTSLSTFDNGSSSLSLNAVRTSNHPW